MTTSWAGKLPLVTALVFVWQVIALTRDRPNRGAKVRQLDYTEACRIWEQKRDAARGGRLR